MAVQTIKADFATAKRKTPALQGRHAAFFAMDPMLDHRRRAIQHLKACSVQAQEEQRFASHDPIFGSWADGFVEKGDLLKHEFSHPEIRAKGTV